MKCIHCQGEMKPGTAPFHIDRSACHVTLDSVPAWVCTQCGEAYFEEKEVDAIQELVKAIEEKTGAFATAS
ncbi:MAG: YgiT-type zinc finger protein [Candidatus Hydrogenedentes bacterium]|nr:YgiT-type zinc finger protein [Candidatus Hydrogenedentota bacterium]